MPVDPETLGQMMLSAKRINDNHDLWTETYGFAHNCRCDEDYANERMCEIPDCYAQMSKDALEACKTFRFALGRIAAGELEDPAMYAGEFIR